MNKRFENVINKMNEEGINQLIICDEGSIYYLTGQKFDTLHRMIALLISVDKEPILFIHEMFPTRGLEDVKVHYWKDTDNYLVDLYNEIDSSKQLAVDKYFESRYLISLLEQGLDLLVKNGSYIIDDIRAVKTADEIKLMHAVSEINDKVMLEMEDYIANYTGTDLTELHLKDVLIQKFEQYTDEGYSTPIICFGINATDPHHEPDSTILKEHDGIMMDIGCKKDGYVSDMTRTVFKGQASEFNREIFEIVKEAQKRAINTIKPGVKFSEIDAAARDYITEKGYGEYFIHRLGHFIGMEPHEAGDVSGSNHNVAVEGMTFSVEPGIYIRDKAIGVRIENLVVVTKDGCDSLNKIPTDYKEV